MANSTKLILDAFSDLGKQLGDRFYFTGLKDCPSIYVGHSGDYLVVNDDENGISFTGVEKIAEDLIDYGFSPGEGGVSSFFTGLSDTPDEYDDGKYLISTENGLSFTGISFTGLSDTPSDFTAGKYLRVNDDGDALEYVDITGVSSGGSGGSATSYIDSVVTKTEAGPIDKRSTDTTASNTNYYRVPVESLRFDDLEVGATYRISVRLRGYGSSDDLGTGLTIYNRASSFSSDINLDLAGINNFNNAGGDNDPAVIALNVADNVGTTYGTSYFDSNIFTATGTHLDVLANSVSQKSFIELIRIQLEKITVGGSSSSNYEFCRSAFSSSSAIGHNISSLDLDPNQLTTNSQDWTHTDTTLNVVGIKIPEDGLYNLNFHIAADAAGNGSHWINNISFINGELKCAKLDGTTNTVISQFDSKNTGNGTNISSDFAQDNEYFNAGDFLYINSRLYDGTGGSITFPLNSRSFFSISKAGTGGSGSSGSSTDFVGLTDTPVDYIGHSGDYMIVNDGENGIHFTGIEKIAQDLTDYGFSAGEGGGSSYFTGLLDTPNDYTNQAGKYVRVSAEEDGLDFVASSELLGLGSVDGYDFCADLHLQSNTTNNSTSFQDLSYDPYIIAAQNVKHSTLTTPVYGTSSFFFDGDGRISVGDNSSFATFSKKLINNYTIQFWINPIIGSQEQPIMGTAGQSTDHGFRILLRSDNKVQFDIFKGLSTDTAVTLISSSAISASTWTHIALVNDNNVFTFYINGTPSGTINFTNSGTNITPTYALLIGGIPLDNQGIAYLNAYMQDIRIDRAAFNPQYFPPEDLTNSQCSANQSELTFSSLKDTPVNYSNAGGKYVRVSENESELEYVGITIAGSTNNEFSNSFVTQNITQDQEISEFSFGGLDIGKTYRLSTTLSLNADTASDFPKVDFYNGDTKIISLFSKGSTSTVSSSMLFIARNQNISASGRDLSPTAYVMGNPEISFMQLELPPSIAVELDEEVITPPSTGVGAGVFTIGDIKANTIIEDQAHLIEFKDIVEQQNEELGISGVFTIGDIKLNSFINLGEEFGGYKEFFTGKALDEQGNELPVFTIGDVKSNVMIGEELESTYNLHNIIPIFTDLGISNIKVGASISVQHPTTSNFGDEMPLFGVLNISDMKLASTITPTGIGQNQTSSLPTGAFYWE